MKIYLDIFFAFFRPGIFTFGGGPSAIPLMQKEVVETYHWLSIQDFTDALALGNALPGPIATKMSALIGYKVCGWTGALVAILATVVPTALAVIFLFTIYMKFKEAPLLKGMMVGVRPVVVIMIFQAVVSLGQKSFPGITTWVIAGVAAVALFKFNMHPALLIICALTFGGIFLR